MTNSLIEPFVRDGFVKLAGAVPSPVVDACVDLLWEADRSRPERPIDVDRARPVGRRYGAAAFCTGHEQPRLATSVRRARWAREVEATHFDGELPPQVP